MISEQPVLRVTLPPAPDLSYDIFTGQGLLDKAGTLIKEKLGQKRCVIVTDKNVAVPYLKRLEASLSTSGHKMAESVTLPAGESTKSWAKLQELAEAIAARGGDRKTLLIALGGGVVGDLAGFAASVYMRGIDFVQIPTSLLAQVDSSVGGKTGIDTSFGKNSVGSFYQPRLVIADSDVLDTLPKRQLLAGYAEVVKYGLVMDEDFFYWCEKNAAGLIAGQTDKRLFAIRRCCEIKAHIVREDERETGRRALLNLGHTFGHALESATGFSDALLHGEAVSIGTVMAFRLSASLKLCPAEDVKRVASHFSKIGLPVKPPKARYDIEKLVKLMTQDKKAEEGALTLILVRGIGQGFAAKNVAPEQIRQTWIETLG